MKQGIIICGHGTKSNQGKASFFKVYRMLEKNLAESYVLSYGFLEHTEPGLSQAIEGLIEKGLREIIILPALLFKGVHTTHDIPFIVQAIKKKHPGFIIKMAAPLDMSQTMIKLCQQQIAEQLASLNETASGAHLLLVGVGSSQPEANIKIATLTRILWEKFPLSYASYSFLSRLTFPSLDDELERLKQLQVKDLIVLPLVLFPGMYLEKIHQSIGKYRNDFQGSMRVCRPFEDNDILIEAFTEKLREVTHRNSDLLADYIKIDAPRKPKLANHE